MRQSGGMRARSTALGGWGSLGNPEKLLGQAGHDLRIAAGQQPGTRRNRVPLGIFEVDVRQREPAHDLDWMDAYPVWSDAMQTRDQRLAGIIELEARYPPASSVLVAKQRAPGQPLANPALVDAEACGEVWDRQGGCQE